MIFNWILINKLAIGTPITIKEENLFIKDKGIKSILDLRNNEDFIDYDQKKYVENLKTFEYKNIQLPDHKTGRLAKTDEINNVVDILEKLLNKGPVFMHCHASAERSPLISIAYLHLKKGLPLILSCDYVKQQNKTTNINMKQLKNIKNSLDKY